MKYLFLILFFIVAFFKVPPMNGWAYRQYLGFAFICVLISIMLTKKFHISVGLCFLITAIFGLFIYELPQFGGMVISSIMALFLFSCMALGAKESLLNLILPSLMVIAHILAMSAYWSSYRPLFSNKK